jgi:hypothetical protein
MAAMSGISSVMSRRSGGGGGGGGAPPQGQGEG